jgi:molybdate transport system substrate-binding protein
VLPDWLEMPVVVAPPVVAPPVVAPLSLLHLVAKIETVHPDARKRWPSGGHSPEAGGKKREDAMGNGLVRAVAAMLGASTLIFAETARADEIRVMASNAFKEAYLELVPQFEQASRHKVVTSFVGSADIMKRMMAGENTDLVILAGASVDELIKLGKVVPGSRVDLAKSGVGVAVRAGAPKPDIGSRDALKLALLAAKSIGYSSGPSGTYLAGLFQRMGIADEVKPKIRQTPPGVAVGDLIARGEVEIGFQQVSELLPIKGIDFLGPLPPDVQQVTVFSAGLHVSAKEPGAAKTLVQFLTSPAALPVIKKKGMEPG